MNNETAPISIFRYDTEVATVKNRVTLRQNLFSFLLEGQKTVYYAGSTVSITPGQFLLLSAGNCLMSEMTTAEDGFYRSLLITFDNHVLADFFITHPYLLQTKAGKTEEEPVLLFEMDAFLQSLLDSLNHLLDKHASASMQLLKLNELLLYLAENYPGILQKLRNNSREMGEELTIRQAVTANIGLPITVEELAFLCNTSLSTFKRRFAKIYGTSPNKWLLDKKMQKAAELLKQGGQKPGEIYYQLGYESLSSFIQSFKQAHGVTPKQYQLNI